MTITAHSLVKNESRFIWYSIKSVIEEVDKILLWDTGSTDGTKTIIKELAKEYPSKIIPKEFNSIDPNSFSKLRQEMLDHTKSDWLLILDGDEVWWRESIKKIIYVVHQNKDVESIVVPTINLVGDMFHKQTEKAGKYNLAGKSGHLNLRLINCKIPGLHVVNEYGKEGYADSNDNLIQNRDSSKIVFVDAPYLHLTHLLRSDSSNHDKEVMQRARKNKNEIGISLPSDYYYPESFFMDRPKEIPFVWKPMSKSFIFKSLIMSPLIYLKRNL